MGLKQITFSDLVLRTSKGSELEVSVMPLGTTSSLGDVRLLCLCDGRSIYFIFNQMLEMSRRNPISGEYTSDVFETVILSGSVKTYGSLPTVETPAFSLDWPGGPVIWKPARFERLFNGDQALRVTLEEGITTPRAFGGRVIEYLLAINLVGSDAEWIVKSSSRGPDYLSIEPSQDGFWGVWR